MNILHISRTMGQGGAEKVVYQICKEASSDFKMFIASTGGYYEDELKKVNVNHYTIPDIDNKSPIKILKTFLLLNKIIRKEKIDIVHSHHRMAAFYSRILNIFNKNFKRIYTAHNVFFDKKKLLRFSLKGSKIIAVGNGVKDNLVNVYNIDKENIEVIYNSIEPKITGIENDTMKKLSKKRLIGTIGRLSKQKGVDIYLRAVSNIIKEDKNVYAIIIGDGEDRNKLENLAKNLDIESNTIFLGFQSNIFDLLKQLDFVVLASRWEGFPLTPIEAFAMRKTIIASDIDGNNEIVKNDINGLLFEKDNVVDLTKKINKLLNDSEKKLRLEKTAYADYKNKYSYQVFIDCYTKKYKEMM